MVLYTYQCEWDLLVFLPPHGSASEIHSDVNWKLQKHMAWTMLLANPGFDAIHFTDSVY